VYGRFSPRNATKGQNCDRESVSARQCSSKILCAASLVPQARKRHNADGLPTDCVAIRRRHQRFGYDYGGSWLRPTKKRAVEHCWQLIEVREELGEAFDQESVDQLRFKKLREPHDLEILLWFASYGTERKRAWACLGSLPAWHWGHEAVQASLWQIQKWVFQWSLTRPRMRGQKSSSPEEARGTKAINVRKNSASGLRRGRKQRTCEEDGKRQLLLPSLKQKNEDNSLRFRIVRQVDARQLVGVRDGSTVRGACISWKNTDSYRR